MTRAIDPVFSEVVSGTRLRYRQRAADEDTAPGHPDGCAARGPRPGHAAWTRREFVAPQRGTFAASCSADSIQQVTWRVEYTHHPVWSRLSDIQSHLDYLLGKASPGDRDNLLVLADLVSKALSFASSPDVTITQRSLDRLLQLAEEMAATLPDLTSIFSAKYRPRSDDELSVFEALAELIRPWPSTGQSKLSGLGAQVSNLAALMEATRSQTDSEMRQLSAQAEARTMSLVNQAEVLENRLTQMLDDSARTDSAAKDLIARVEYSLTQQNEAFSEALTERRNELASWFTDSEKDLEAMLRRSEALAEEYVERLRAHEKQSEAVLSAVGSNSTATDYGAYANEQRKAANWWRAGAVTLLSLAGLWFVGASIGWFPVQFGTDFWEVVVVRIGITAAVIGVGIYCARESSQHRAQERRAKQTQLVLTAVGPFIANLPADQQSRIRDETARAIFTLPGHQEDATVTSEHYSSMMNSLIAKIPEAKN